MGEYADMIIDGFVDQYTGEVIDGHSPGYPRSKSRRRTRQGFGSIKCEKCGKKFTSRSGADHHFRDIHTNKETQE